MEIITNSQGNQDWQNLAPFYPRFNALFPSMPNINIKYINSLAALKACTWTDEMTFANVMCLDCAKYIAENPARFPKLRAIILSGHDICCDKDLAVPSGLGWLPALTMLGLEYGRSCAISETLPNILEIHFNELSCNLAKEVETRLEDDWVSRWFPNCQATYWH
jgi:hypothetical protein